MESNPATRAIARMAVAFTVGDLFLALLAVLQQPDERILVAALIGTLIGQFGLGCAAILRHETLRDGAVCWMFLLVSGSAILPVFFNQAHNSGYITLFALIITGVSLATNLLPCVVFRWIGAKPGIQFSILHIMLLMNLVGIGIVAVSTMHAYILYILAAMGAAFSLLAPSAIGSLLIGILSQKQAFVACMVCITLFISAGWLLIPKVETILVYLLAQTLTVAVGGYVLMLAELETSSSPDPSSAATANQLRSEIAPDPLDEP